VLQGGLATFDLMDDDLHDVSVICGYDISALFGGAAVRLCQHICMQSYF
jgi:hypothetical protein